GRFDHEPMFAQHDLVTRRQVDALAAPAVDARRGAFGFEDQSFFRLRHAAAILQLAEMPAAGAQPELRRDGQPLARGRARHDPQTGLPGIGDRIANILDLHRRRVRGEQELVRAQRYRVAVAKQRFLAHRARVDVHTLATRQYRQQQATRVGSQRNVVRIDARPGGYDVIARCTADVHGTGAAGNGVAGWVDANDAHDVPGQMRA